MEKYDPIRVLGEGSFGKVYLMRDKIRRKFLCVKVIKIKNIPKKEREATKVEVDLLRRLHHPNIVRYIDSFLSKNNESLCIAMEYCDGGDLASQIKAARRKMFSEEKILHWFVQITLGLHYMHSNKVLHRDLKTQNIFLLGNGRLVLGDLGISKVLEGTMDFAQTCIGTPYYMSPEIFKNKPYSYKSDVWALGCVLYEMTTLDHAFDANSINGLACKIIKGKYPPVHAKYTRHLRDLISQLLLTNPQQRPDLDQILRKPFIKKHIMDFFTDIAARPSASLGEGTMIVRAAAGGASNGAIDSDVNMLSLRQQLDSLDMMKEVVEALNPKSIPADPNEAKKFAKDQASALRREEDHKKMVEAALEKLRVERELRAKQRGGVIGQGQGGAIVPQKLVFGKEAKVAPSDRPMKPAAFRQPQRGPSQVSLNKGPSQGAIVQPPSVQDQQAAPKVRDGGGIGRRDRNNEANNPSDSNERERRRRSYEPSSKEGGGAGGVAGSKDRYKQIDDRRRVDGDDKRREEVRAEARQREEAKLRQDVLDKEEAAVARHKQELLKLQQEAASKRELLRDRERLRQRDEIEQLKKDKQELDRRARERERLREERRAEERKKLEEEREKERLAELSEEKAYSSRSNKLDEKDNLSARDRVLLRKQEKLAREEAERKEALMQAENENRRLRALAYNQQKSQFQSQLNSAQVPLVNKVNIVDEDSNNNNKDNGKVKGKVSSGGVSSSNSNGNMALDELSERLREVTEGQGRYGAASVEPGGGGGNIPYSSRSDLDDGLDDGLDDTESEDEQSAVWDSAGGGCNVDEEEEDMHKREVELQAELTMATRRCNELKQTLQETKSFMEDRGVSMASILKNNNHRVSSMAAVAPSTIVSAAGEEDDDSEEYDEFDEEEDDDDYEDNNADDDEDEKSSAYAIPKISPRNNIRSPAIEDPGLTPRLLKPAAAAIRPSPYDNLQDPPSPFGKLGERIKRLRDRCKEALGKEAFDRAYIYLKLREESTGADGRGLYEDDDEEVKVAKVREILGSGKAHFLPLIEQLIFMEETHSG